MSKESLITLCFKTEDAIQRDEDYSKFRFEMRADRAKLKPSKISLGSLEFPMVQYSVEDKWSRLYFCESVKITSVSREISFTETVDRQQITETATLPLTLNQIKKLSTNVASSVVFEFEHAHGLNLQMFEILEKEKIKIYLIHSSDGATLLNASGTSILSEHKIALKSDLVRNSSNEGLSHGFLYCEEPPCPSVLCSIIKQLLFKNQFANSYTLTFEQKECKAMFSQTGFGIGIENSTMALTGDTLLQRLGYGNGAHRSVKRGTSHATGVASHDVERIGDSLPSAIESTIFGGFDYISLPVGWYIPSHRPMATGQPLQLPREIDSKLNRFMFLAKESQKDILIIFKDFRGRTHVSKVLQGCYNVFTIALEIERAMNSVDKESDLNFIFTFDPCQEQFIASCQKNGELMRLDLLFSHPLSIDAERFGFKRTDYVGYDTYKSDRIHIPRLEWPRRDWCNTTQACVFPSNTYTISENGSSKQISLDANAKPNLFGIIREYWEDSHILLLSVFANAGAFSHGVQAGDMLRVYKLTKAIKHTDGNEVKQIDPADLECRRTIMAVCISNLSGESDTSSNTIKLYIPNHEWKRKIDTCIGIDMQSKPFNLNFAQMEKSITGKRLGFRNKVYEWGIDGSVSAGNLSVAPYIAPFVHAIDHPDYVLMYIEEGKKSTALQHRSGNNVTMPFAKIVLYPLFREERMIPKETTLTSGESLTTLTIYFRNPDDSPYHFHGAEFSFTLNFIV